MHAMAGLSVALLCENEACCTDSHERVAQCGSY